MAIKCENQSFKIHKCAFEKDGFKKYGAWTGFKNKAGEWHDVYISLLFMREKSNIDLTPQTRVRISGAMTHDKSERDGKVYESWSVFVDDCEIVSMGGEQGSRRQPMTQMDEQSDCPF